MPFGVYKPGQGYWVRMMTAVFTGILFLVAAAWGWDQAEAAPIPVEAHEFSVTVVDGQPSDEMLVVLERSAVGGAFEQVGTALAETYNAATERTGRLVLKGIDLQSEEISISSIERVRSQDAADAFTASVSSWDAIPMFPRLYLQAGVASGIILLGVIVVYWFTGANRRSVDFLVATDGEMKKVNWSTKKEIIGSTQVVIVAAVLISLILFVIDLAFSNFFRMIGVLES